MNDTWLFYIGTYWIITTWWFCYVHVYYSNLFTRRSVIPLKITDCMNGHAWLTTCGVREVQGTVPSSDKIDCTRCPLSLTGNGNDAFKDATWKYSLLL